MEERSAVERVIRWLRIRQRSGLPFPAGYDELVDEMWNSALLQRLLAGEEPLRIPPPRSHGHPWYALVENGYATNCLVRMLQDRADAPPKVSVNEAPWLLVERVSDDELVLQYRDDAPLYVAHRDAEGGWSMTRYDAWVRRPRPEVAPAATEPARPIRRRPRRPDLMEIL